MISKDLVIKQLVNTDEEVLNTITTWMYNCGERKMDTVLMELNVLCNIAY